MFERKGALEPGIEHTMRKNEIRCGGFVKALPDDKAVVLPEAMDDYAIEFVAVLFEPLQQGARVMIPGQAWAESVHSKRSIMQPRRFRFVQRHDLDLHAVLLQPFAQRNDATGYAARFGIQRLHCLQNSQVR